jgi:hypothetical protein
MEMAVQQIRGLNGMDHFEAFNHGQAMPDRMNYERVPFGDRKPDHVAPPKAREGFTRSPTENDVVVCPSCDEELVHVKDAEEPVFKKGGKAPTRKEREEHPFWVVKECGHVKLCLHICTFSTNMIIGLLQQMLPKPSPFQAPAS